VRRSFWFSAVVAVAVCPTATLITPCPDGSREERITMADSRIVTRGVTDQNVIEAMRTVPRHRFVPDDNRAAAYGDHPLPIGYGQTISQPSLVAMMSEALGVGPGDKVLEIGAGSGYQAAILSAMGCEVYTVEIIPDLATRAKAILDELGYQVTVTTADGYIGWSEHAPFDGIIVTAAAEQVPGPLIEQLKDGAALIIPVGPAGGAQTLRKITIDEDGLVSSKNLGLVRFVPFTRARE